VFAVAAVKIPFVLEPKTWIVPDATIGFGALVTRFLAAMAGDTDVTVPPPPPANVIHFVAVPVELSTCPLTPTLDEPSVNVPVTEMLLKIAVPVKTGLFDTPTGFQAEPLKM